MRKLKINILPDYARDELFLFYDYLIYKYNEKPINRKGDNTDKLDQFNKLMRQAKKSDIRTKDNFDADDIINQMYNDNIS